MNHPKYHLAQLNIARLLAPLEDPQIKEFVDGLEPINQLAESSPGFVWRLKDEEIGNATDFRPFDDDMLIINMSVWEDVDSLKNFAYKSHHVEYFNKRLQWFEKMKEAHYVLWWVTAGHEPDIWEAKERLEYLRKNGESPKAFTFRKIFEP